MYFNELDQEQKQSGGIVSLKNRLAYLIQSSQDPAFTRYLMQMQSHVSSEEKKIALMSEDVEKQYQVYLRNMQKLASAQGQMPTPQPATVAMPVSEPAPEAEPTPVSEPALEAEPTPVQQSVPEAEPTPVQQVAPQPAPQPVKKKRNAEFTIGAAVLSIVGSAFVLISMVLLGMYFMEGLMKGMLLYALCMVVIVLSEILLYKRWTGLGMTFSAVGMAGLYVSTMVNYLTLGNFNEWVSIGVSAIITLFIVFMSRKRDAASYRVLGMIAMYLCYVLILCANKEDIVYSQTQIVVVSIISLFVNIMCISVPIKKGYTAVNVIHMILNGLFTFGMGQYWIASECISENGFIENWQYLFFLGMAVLIMQLIFCIQLRWSEKQPSAATEKNPGICIAYCVSAVLFSIMLSEMTSFGLLDDSMFYRLGLSLVLALLGGLPIALSRKNKEKWFSWMFLNLAIFLMQIHTENMLEVFVYVLVLLLLAKGLSFVKSMLLQINDAALTLLTCLMVMVVYDKVETLILVAGLLVSVLCIRYWKTYYEVIITLALAVYTVLHMIPSLKLPVFVGILFVGMLVFNNVKRWRGKLIVVYNALAVIGQIFCYLLLVNPVYQNAYLTYLCMLIFGTATIVICIRDPYFPNLDIKEWALAIFMTYMGLIIRTNYPIVNSILLMLVSLVCVGTGFYNRKKSIRIYGLTLSLFVCGKLVLYDFGGVNMLQKTILFFVVGVIALVIASIYMILEKKQEKKEQQEG